jgi:hypothetical protein
VKIVYLEADPLLDYWVAMAAICAPQYHGDGAELQPVYQQIQRRHGRANLDSASRVPAVYYLE